MCGTHNRHIWFVSRGTPSSSSSSPRSPLSHHYPYHHQSYFQSQRHQYQHQQNLTRRNSEISTSFSITGVGETCLSWQYIPWASYQIRKIVGCACAGNAGNFFPHRRLQRKPIVNDPGVPWCMSGSLTLGGGKSFPGIPGACAPAILRIWQEAHEIRRQFCGCFMNAS